MRGLDLKGLRSRWQSVTGRTAPPHLPRHLLFAMIAYRIQAEALGDLDAETLRLLKRIGSARFGADVVPLRYRYYVSQRHLRGLAKSSPGSVARVPAEDIEAAVIKALAVHLNDRNTSSADQCRIDRSIVAAKVVRIDVRKNQLAVRLKAPGSDGAMDFDQASERDRVDAADGMDGALLLIPWCKPPSRKFRELLLPPAVSRHKIRPIKAERRAALLKSIARGRDWLDEIISGAVQGVEQIAARHKCSVRHVNMTISMAFIAPALIKAAVEGRLPRGIGIASLRDAPAEWSRQLERLGLPQPI